MLLDEKGYPLVVLEAKSESKNPYIGDAIHLPFMEQVSGKNYHGYVHNVKHIIDGKTQKIFIEVHPFNNFSYKWARMKEDYEDWKRRKASLKYSQ